MSERKATIEALRYIAEHTFGGLAACDRPERFSEQEWEKITREMGRIATELHRRADKLEDD